MQNKPAFFEDHAIRRIYDEKTEIWWFSVIDIVQGLTQSSEHHTARKYWNKLKERLKKEESQLAVMTDVSTAEILLCLVQSVSSPIAEQIKG